MSHFEREKLDLVGCKEIFFMTFGHQGLRVGFFPNACFLMVIRKDNHIFYIFNIFSIITVFMGYYFLKKNIHQTPQKN